MALLRRQSGREIAEGAVFERARANNVVERATVVWIGKDHAGIPHVRFLVSFSGHDDSLDTRMLALAEFKQHYDARAAASH